MSNDFMGGQCGSGLPSNAQANAGGPCAGGGQLPGCSGGRVPVYFTREITAQTTETLTICPRDKLEVVALVVTAVGADLSSSNWQWNQLPIFEPESTGVAGDVSEDADIADFTVAALNAGINLLPASVNQIGDRTALTVDITNGHATAAQSVSGYVICRRLA